VAVLPWELVLLGAAAPLWFRLSGSHELAAPAEGVGAVAQVPARLVAVPILVVAGAATLAARLAAWWLRRRGPRRTPTGPGTYLAWRRLGREAAVAALLAAATAVPIAVAAYGSVVTGSVRATLAAEARTLVGADVVLTLSHPVPVPPALAGRATEVLRLRGVDVGGVSADVLAIDPGTFTRDAFWDDRLSGGRSLGDLARRLATGTQTVLAAQPVPGGQQLMAWHGYAVGTVAVENVDRLPAQQGGYPVILARREALGDDAQFAVPQLWVRGDPARVRQEAAAARLPLTRIEVADDIYAGTLFEPLTYTFDYLTALSLLTGLVAAVGLVLYLEGRGPAHRRGYVLLRRMGLRRGTHRWALVAEVALPLALGLGGGVALAAAIVTAVRSEIEINPLTPPGTVLAVPVATLVAAAAAIVALALVAAAYADHRVARADPAEVLRDT
jgi:putative ABC transport system permease protein